MKKIFLLFVFLFASVFVNGCLVFEQAEYVITIDKSRSGTAEILIQNIRSDAMLDSEFMEDRTNLFDYVLNSNEFAAAMVAEGKQLQNRELFVEDDKLVGRVKYAFTEINRVEGIIYDEGYFFLTLEPSDSIVSTNGEVFVTQEYKRIIWDESFTELKFKLFMGLPDHTRPLAPFVKQ